MKNLKLIWSSAYAALVTGIVTVAVTIYMEYSPAFKVVLTSPTSHHWISKSLGSLVLYFILWFVINKSGDDKNELQVRRALWWLFIFTILSSLAIFAFFVWHYLSAI